ncbi:MAG TPA: FtsQ-type POTRA domain-containing protein [Ornithinibacter sp.]|nr:FtsQ-type POTRA domain-containing protein [Ornithinibacter sp.]
MSLGTTRRHTADHGVTSSANRFRERALSNRRRPWRRAFLVVLAAAALALVVWVVGWSTWLGVDQVEVTGVTGAEAAAVVTLVDVPVGTPLARVDTEAVGSAVRERVTIAEVSVRRSWPGTLTVEVVPRSAALVVRNPQGRLEVVDAEGVSFGTVRAAPKGVPVVTATGTEGTTREALQSSLALLEALPADLATAVSGIKVSSANLITFTLGSRTVVWGGGEDSARKVAILTALLATKAKVIDVSAPDTPVTR